MLKDSDSENEKYLGGELTMWMDQYCETPHCGLRGGLPKAYWMFQQEYDQEFIRSVLGLVGSMYALLYSMAKFCFNKCINL